MSCATMTPAADSALGTDNVTTFCVELLNVIGQPSRNTTPPDILCLFSLFAAYSESDISQIQNLNSELPSHNLLGYNTSP